MKTIILSIILALVSFSSFANETPKTKMSFMMKDTPNLTAVGFKEERPDGELGVVFSCNHDENLLRVTYSQPTMEGEPEGTIAVVYYIRINMYTRGTLSGVMPFDTIGEGMWRLPVAAGVMANGDYNASFSIAFYGADGKLINETRKFSDIEMGRALGAIKRVKGCQVSEIDNPKNWESYLGLDFDVYQ